MIDEPLPDGRPDPADAAGRVEWRAATVAVAIIAITILPAFMTGALAVQIGQSTGMDLAGIGGLYAVVFGMGGVTSTPTGQLVQRLDWPAGIRLAASGSGLALLGMAMLPDGWWARWWPIAIIFALAGMAAATSQAASNLALARSVPASRYGLVFGLKHTAVPVAAMLGGLAVPAFGLTIGWRWAYATAALLALLVFAAVPLQSRITSSRDRHDRRPSRPATPTRSLVTLAGAAALGHSGTDALGAFIVAYAVSIGVAEGTAGVLLTLGSAAGLIVRFVSGWLVDRRQEAGLSLISAMLFVGAVGVIVIVTGGRPALTFAVVMAFAFGWGWAGLLAFAVVRANPDAAAVASGIVNTGKYIGAGGGPLLFGFLADRFSFTVAWWVAIAGILAASLVIAVLRMTPGGRTMVAPPHRPPASTPPRPDPG